MENEPSKLKNFIPLDKSWIIRMGVLDLINKYPDALDFLEGQKNLSDDLVVLKRICRDWADKENIDVGESGTLYRFLQFISWKYGLNKKVIKHGTLKTRDICNNPKITSYPLRKLGLMNFFWWFFLPKKKIKY